MNQLVRRHIQTVVAAAPGKAVSTLENDTYELIAAGMVTLDSRLAGVEDDKLIMRIVDLWTFFWVQVLPYLEGVSRSLVLSSLFPSLIVHSCDCEPLPPSHTRPPPPQALLRLLKTMTMRNPTLILCLTTNPMLRVTSRLRMAPLMAPLTIAGFHIPHKCRCQHKALRQLL